MLGKDKRGGEARFAKREWKATLSKRRTPEARLARGLWPPPGRVPAAFSSVPAFAGLSTIRWIVDLDLRPNRPLTPLKGGEGFRTRLFLPANFSSGLLKKMGRRAIGRPRCLGCLVIGAIFRSPVRPLSGPVGWSCTGAVSGGPSAIVRFRPVLVSRTGVFPAQDPLSKKESRPLRRPAFPAPRGGADFHRPVSAQGFQPAARPSSCLAQPQRTGEVAAAPARPRFMTRLPVRAMAGIVSQGFGAWTRLGWIC